MMAEDVPDDIDGFDTGMLEWYYVEDDFPLAVSERVILCIAFMQRAVSLA